jgi:hypothetical protein
MIAVIATREQWTRSIINLVLQANPEVHVSQTCLNDHANEIFDENCAVPESPEQAEEDSAALIPRMDISDLCLPWPDPVSLVHELSGRISA